jgi:glutamine amidotransferase
MTSTNFDTSVAIVDYGMGNINSVAKMVKFLNYNPFFASNKKDLEKAKYIILPGVGSFSKAYENLSRLDLIDTLNEQVLIKRKPFLGICLGMQLVSEKGYEGSESPGLGWIKGETIKIIPTDNHKVPHMGWDEISIKGKSNLFDDIKTPKPSFYFCHSYVLQPEKKDIVLAEFSYEKKYVATIQKENICGSQFHPEKSQEYGKVFLENFLNNF